MTRFNEMSGGRQALILGTVVLVLCVVLFALAEGVVRIRHYVKFGNMWGVEDTYEEQPGSNLRVPIAGSKFGAIEINSLGFRGPEISADRVPGSLRIAFAGASTTYCAEVSGNDMTWPSLVADALRARWPGMPIDFVNGGVPGYNAKTSVRNVRHRIAPLAPDVIVIYHAVNDLTLNSYRLAVEQGLVERRTEESLTWPSEYSLLWYLVEKNLRIMAQKSTADVVGGRLEASAEQLADPFRDDLAELVRVSSDVAREVVLVTFSTHLRAEQDAATRAEAAATNLYYMPYMSTDSLVGGFAAYNAAVRDVAAETGALLIANENAIPGDGRHFADSVHFTDRGSQAMAERVTTALLASDRFVGFVESLRAAGSGAE